MSLWMWWITTACGHRLHTGEKNGTPFHTSKMASRRPCQPITSLTMVDGNTK